MKHFILFCGSIVPVGVCCQAPSWEWATPFGYTYPGAATMDETGNNFYMVGYEDNAMACGQELTANGMGYYVTCTDWQNACQWALPVPRHLGSLYIDDLGQLRFQGWFEQPLAMVDTVFDPGEGTMIVDGAIDPDLGLIDGYVVARARYDLTELYPVRMLRDNGHILLAVNFSDSVRFDDSLFVSGTARSVLAEFDASGALLQVRDVGSGDMQLSDLAEDANERVFLAGGCSTCEVLDSLIEGSDWFSAFVACMDNTGGTEWIWARTGASDPSADLLITADDRVVIGSTDVNNGGFDPWSYAEILNSDGQSVGDFIIATRNGSVNTPHLTVDAEQNIIGWGYYVGSDPDQNIVCADPDGNVLWSLPMNQGGNLWTTSVYPVDTGTYLITGQFEFSISLGPYFLQWQPAGFTNGFIAKLGDFTVDADDSSTTGHDLLVSPNPVHASLHLHSPIAADGTCRILDMRGREVMQVDLTGRSTITDVSDLDPGLYLVLGAGGSARFVKE